MRRVFTHLSSGWQTTPSIHRRKAFSLEDPDCPTLVVLQASKTTKVLSQRARGSREYSFFFFFRTLFISFILLIQFNFVLTFLKDARTRRLPESTSRSGRARSHGLTGPLSVRLCDPYALARPRTTSTIITPNYGGFKKRTGFNLRGYTESNSTSRIKLRVRRN